ncbi:MAG: endospore germination permease [Defluviitaleaceae bacterium]|nr:endospore germination permease [Defluviitaleaceae bacterium]
MSSNRKISMRQLKILIILSAMGTGVIVLPHRAAEFLPNGVQDGWVIAVGLVLMAIAVGALISSAARAAQKAAGGEPSFIISTSALLSKPIAYTIGAILWLKLVLAAGLELRIFLKIARDVMLPNTPMPVVGAVMLFTCAYAAAKGFETRARVAEVLFALLILPFLFMFIVSILDADFSNLQPVLVNDARALVLGTLRLGFILTGLECLLLVSPYVPREKNLTRSVIGAIAIAGAIIIAITVLTIAAVGRGLDSEPWPVLSMMDTVSLPGSFIERQEALMFGFWIITAFALANAMLFFGGLLVNDMFKKATLRSGVLLTALAVFGISILPLARDEIFMYIDCIFITTGVFFLVILPITLLVAAKITTWGNSKLLLILLIPLTILSGCWDKVEIENRAFVVAMAVDKGENYTVSLSIPVFDEEDDDESGHIQSAEGRTITEALRKLDERNDRELYFGQTKLVVLGTELLEDSELLQGAINTLDNKLEATRRIQVLAAKNPEKILEANPPGEKLSGLYASDICKKAFTMDFDSFSKSENAVLPKIKHSDDELKRVGAVIINNLRKTASLNTDELRGFLWCFPDANKRAVITVDPPLSLQVESHKAEIIFENADDPNILRAIIEVNVKGICYEYVNNKNLFKNAIEEEIQAAFEIFQKNLATDAYNFSELLRKKNYPLYKQHSADFGKSFAAMEIVPRVNVQVLTSL